MMDERVTRGKRHSNVSVFVPHAGCLHRCSFCNQCAISGATKMPTQDDVRKACDTAVSTMQTSSENSQIAFFGGSFTAIPKEIMVSLLEAASPYIRNGCFAGIRISTRPDAIDEQMLELLKSYNVSAVELGAQSMDDAVLKANNRGHTAANVETASRLIHNAGVELGLQMMTGLYKSSDKQDLETAKRLALLQPATVRIYPTVVMEHTDLAKLYRSGKYNPPSISQAVKLCSRLLKLFKNKNIKVIRLGLHSTSEMQEGMVAGPWHPAFRELCESLLLYDIALDKLKREIPEKGKAVLIVNPKSMSRMVGQKRCNIIKFAKAGYYVIIKEDSLVAPEDVIVVREENSVYNKQKQKKGMVF